MNNKKIKDLCYQLNLYLEIKRTEINKIKENINSIKNTKDEYLDTKVCIEEKISKLSNKKDMNENDILHIQSLKNNLNTYVNDIVLLTLEISSLNEMLEDLEVDYEMVQKEIYSLENN